MSRVISGPSAMGGVTRQAVTTATVLSGTANLYVAITALFDGAITLPAANTAGRIVTITDEAGIGSGESTGASESMVHALCAGADTITAPDLAASRTRLLLWKKYGSLSLLDDGAGGWHAFVRKGWHVDPRAISGLKCWYDARRGITLNGTAVSAWADLSSGNVDLAQGVAANQPAYAYASNAPLSAFTSENIVSFDGSNDVLTSAITVAVTSGSLTGLGVFSRIWSTNTDSPVFSSAETATLGFSWFTNRATAVPARGVQIGDSYVRGGGTGDNNPTITMPPLYVRSSFGTIGSFRIGAAAPGGPGMNIRQNRMRGTANGAASLAVPNFTQTINVGNLWAGQVATMMLFDANVGSSDLFDLENALFETFPVT